MEYPLDRISVPNSRPWLREPSFSTARAAPRCRRRSSTPSPRITARPTPTSTAFFPPRGAATPSSPQARQAMADFINARSADEIVFGANMTTLTLHLARALGRT